MEENEPIVRAMSEANFEVWLKKQISEKGYDGTESALDTIEAPFSVAKALRTAEDVRKRNGKSYPKGDSKVKRIDRSTIALL